MWLHVGLLLLSLITTLLLSHVGAVDLTLLHCGAHICNTGSPLWVATSTGRQETLRP